MTVTSPQNSHNLTAASGNPLFGGQGIPQGLAGLFAMLLQGVEMAEIKGDTGKPTVDVTLRTEKISLPTTAAVDAEILPPPTTAPAQSLLTEVTDLLSTLQNTSPTTLKPQELLEQLPQEKQDDIKALAEVLTALKTGKVNLDDIGGVDTLAAAYEELGYPPEEARAKAESVEAALAAIKPLTAEELKAAEKNPLDEATVLQEVLHVQDAALAFAKTQTLQAVEPLAHRIEKGAPLVLELDIEKEVLAQLKHDNKTNLPQTQQHIVAEVQDQTFDLTDDTHVDELAPRVSHAAHQTREEAIAFKLKPLEAKTAATTEIAEAVKPATEATEVLIDGAEEALQNIRDIAANQQKPHSFQVLVGQAQVAKQVAVQFRSLAQKGGGEVKIQLQPAELGQIDIHLDISDGKVKGTIIVQQPEVLEQLARELRSLQQGLADAGLELEQDGIAFMMQEKGQDQDGNKRHQAEADDLLEATEAGNIETSDALSNTEWKNPENLIDVKV